MTAAVTPTLTGPPTPLIGLGDEEVTGLARVRTGRYERLADANYRNQRAWMQAARDSRQECSTAGQPTIVNALATLCKQHGPSDARVQDLTCSNARCAELHREKQAV
jgi:hypothetical protein